MELTNVEIKARCSDPDKIRLILKREGAVYVGLDHQVDTYYQVSDARLKLREGDIEQNLIYYQRANDRKPKLSDIELVPVADEQAAGLKKILAKALGVQIIVDKKREIYRIDNIKFHIDDVKELGTFVEIEAIDNNGTHSTEQLHQQCQHYLELLEIEEQNLVDVSYSDLMARRG